MQTAPESSGPRSGSRQLKHHRRGTHRIATPDETWARIAPLLADFGVTRVADVTGLDEVGIPVFQAIRPDGHIVAVSQGKGITPQLARISAAMEAIEAWHAERVRPAEVYGSTSEIGPLPYALEDLALAPGSLVTDDLVLEWVHAVGLVSGQAIPVPRDYVSLSKLVRPGWAPPTFQASSNGLGSGNSLAEAALHGLCEAVESDCLTHAATLPRADRRRVRLETVDDPVCMELLERLEAAGNAVEVFDVSTDLAVPCFMASIVSEVLPRRFSGAGCHPDPGIALARALTEAAQVRLAVIAGSRDDLAAAIYHGARRPLPARRPDSPADADFRRIPSLASDALDEDLALVVERVHERTGVEPLLVDLSHARYGVPVVMATAPGLACRLESLGFREAR